MKRFRATVYLVLLALLVIPLSAQASDDGGIEWYGTISQKPSANVGTWVIGGQSFQATNSTYFSYEHGSLDIGQCAEVKYYTNNGVHYATEIESTEAYKCSGGDDNYNDDDDYDDNDDSHDDDDGDGYSNDYKRYGFIQSMPSTGLYGTWRINNIDYLSNTNTRFEQEHGAFSVGRCVELHHYDSNGQTLLAELETASDYKCNSNNGSSTVPDVNYAQIYGVLGSFPANLVGTWSIAGVNYTADTSTHFEQEHDPFFVGGCVEVKYNPTTKKATEISTEKSYKCGTTTDNTTGDYIENKFYGFVQVVPALKQGGDWQIDNLTFKTTSTVKLEEEHGQFQVGTCAEVEYIENTDGTKTATEISTERTYKCNGNTTYENEVYGTVTSFPSGYYGSWVIDGNSSYNAGADTQFEGSFSNGVCVKVKYYVKNAVHQAIKIERSDDCSGSNPNLHTYSKIYGTIDSLPSAPYVGQWQIGGLNYTADSNTRFEQEEGSFAVGACVKAKYDDNMTLLKVESESSSDCSKAYGRVEQMPSGSTIGTWQIGGQTYVADSSTVFEQEHGFFAIGAYVEVKYTLNGSTRMATRIETHVAPGSGRSTVTGKLQSRDSSNGTWTVDNDTYYDDPAIEIDDDTVSSVSISNAPQVGQTVIMNVYQGNDGNSYVTYITLAKEVYLPIILR